MAKNKNIIKRVYDKYLPDDYRYGEENSVNLNPIREINFDQLEIIKQRLQQVTDDIIRKQIIKEEDPEVPIRASLSSGLPSKNNIFRQAAQINSGSIGLGLVFPVIDGPINGPQFLLEPRIGAFPAPLLLREFDGPPMLDCDEILKQFGIDGDDDGDDSGDDDASDPGADTSEDSDDNQDEDQDDDDEDDETCPVCGMPIDECTCEEDEFNECAKINLEWLKIILIILRIIKILQMIIDLVLALLVPILEIVMLALIAWIVPPAMEQLRQRITEMVIAIIVMIITKLIAMIFMLLNLDCLSDQTLDIIAQIKAALSAFSSITSMFRSDSISMLFGSFLDQLTDPLDQIAELYKEKKQMWEDAINSFKSEINFSVEDLIEDTKKQLKEGVINGIAQDENVQKVKEITQAAVAAYNTMKNDVQTIIGNLRAVKNLTSGQAPMAEPGSNTKDALLKALGDVEIGD